MHLAPIRLSTGIRWRWVKPLERMQWGGAVDNVGGETLGLVDADNLCLGQYRLCRPGRRPQTGDDGDAVYSARCQPARYQLR